MSKIQVNNVELFYEEVGSGPETIVFSHGYLMSHEMYRAQMTALQDKYRCIAYNHRGHGRSQVTEGGYELDNLYADGEALLEALDCGPCHFVGMSTGGFVALRLGLRRPDLVKSLTLIDTSAEAESEENLKGYNQLLFVVRRLGWWLVIGKVMPILFGEKFLKDPLRQEEVKKWKQIITGHNRQAIYKFGKGIFARDSLVDQLGQINVPTAVIVGEKDIATPPSLAEQLAAGIPNATLHTIPDSGHSSPVEEPEAVTAVMEQFLSGLND